MRLLSPTRRRAGRPLLVDGRCGLAILGTLGMSMLALMSPPVWLWLPGLAGLAMAIDGSRFASPRPLVLLFVWQWLLTSAIYGLFWGSERLGEAALVALRLLLAFLPPWYLAIRFAPERLGAFFANWLSPRWAFVLSASINALPFVLSEARDIYRLQRLRGARIGAKDLVNPLNWQELVHTVISPLLIELLKLSRRQALAAKSRGFGQSANPSHWPHRGKHDED
ncbi:energy-coupling factor transporter transmembrane protein EcfT [Shewanella zhangzhouensis]|uniref:energy-coupling factor transporter transmembrane protein EcfT n=1 Tax=Shewanella zhangzhouensis TaxID=2864213 RepID=UPI001C656A7C|nr:energy-coupling factor transporter transmembrane protein EcfT [Shewanella zhangzhouensis]QYK05407.1 energy-coupling factor transporter transmembrane protein EcfT [Shewanella zhangzhouensis]